jgi:hypothetical protein
MNGIIAENNHILQVFCNHGFGMAYNPFLIPVIISINISIIVNPIQPYTMSIIISYIVLLFLIASFGSFVILNFKFPVKIKQRNDKSKFFVTFVQIKHKA